MRGWGSSGPRRPAVAVVGTVVLSGAVVAATLGTAPPSGAAVSAAPAVSAVITRADYSTVVEQDLARIRAELTVNVLGTPWVEVPIRFGDAAIGKLEAGEQILLKGIGDGNYSLLFGKSGEQKVVIELTARIHTSPEGREFAFDVPTTGITNFEITIPEADQTIEVTPRLIAVPVEAAAKQTRFKASLGSTPRIASRWRPKATSKPEMELLASVTNLTKVSVEDGLIHTDAILAYEVLRGELAQLRAEYEQSEAANRSLSDEIASLKAERQKVRGRLERLLGHIDQLN